LGMELGVANPTDVYLLKSMLGGSIFPTDLHFSMFQNAMNNQCSDEQKEKWMPQIIGGEIIGTYAQTELAHGTFLRGLEITATFDKANDEFIIHSPTDTATKWWPGGLGRTSTHCVLYARLFIDGKDYGPHAFFVQLRGLKDHHPLPGIIVGDIGPKIGFKSNDNGFLRFDHVRIPRTNMLMRYAKVTKEGVYEKPPHAKFNYTTMIFVRTNFVITSHENLAKGVTIAIRYSCVRRQGGIEDSNNTKETQIIDFPAQQNLLFPNLANAYALYFTGRYMRQLYNTFTKRKDDQDFSILPELHATSAGLKAVTTELAANGIETCRLACGGHGYHMFSGLPELLHDFLPQVTGEGANPVLLLQTGRYLLRQYEILQNGGQYPSSLVYFTKIPIIDQDFCQAKSTEDFLDPKIHLEAFLHRAARLLSDVAKSITFEQKKGRSFEKAIEIYGVELITVSRAHCACFILKNFIEGVQSIQSETIKKPLIALLRLFGLGILERELGEFNFDGYFTSQQSRWLKSHPRHLFEEIRPNALALVDAFDFSDFELNSSLGRYDGDCYRDMYRRAQKEPRNQTIVGPAYHDFIKPWLQKSFL